MTAILDICWVPFNSWAEGRIELSNIMAMQSVKKMFLDYYETKVFFGKITPIEKIDQTEKIGLWEQTKEFTDRDTRIEACKVLWVMCYMATKRQTE